MCLWTWFDLFDLTYLTYFSLIAESQHNCGSSRLHVYHAGFSALYSKTCNFFQSPLQKSTNTFLLHKRKNIFGYIVGYIAIAELKAKHFNQSHSHLKPFGYSQTIAKCLKAYLVKWLSYGSAQLYEKLYYLCYVVWVSSLLRYIHDNPAQHLPFFETLKRLRADMD